VGRVIVTHPVAGLSRVEILVEHQPPGLLEPQLLLKLQRTHRRDGLEVGGEALFHSSRLTAVPPDSVAAAFDAVLRLDSSLTPALIHPAELALIHRDSAAYVRYLAVMERSIGAEAPIGRAARSATACSGR
jgi:hypothetical protein